jgi:hypothetical protein
LAFIVTVFRERTLPAPPPGLSKLMVATTPDPAITLVEITPMRMTPGVLVFATIIALKAIHLTTLGLARVAVS